MNNTIIEIDTSLIDAEQNNRQNFDHVPGLAESIRERGQDAPIIVSPKANGRYLLIAGESRTRACAMIGAKVKAMVRNDLTAADGYMLTLVENDARKQTNDMEKAIGYKRAIEQHGYTVEQIARHVGKHGARGLKFVQDRLDLLRLRPDLQHMVQSGQLTIGYAVHLVDLDSNRQLTAVRYLRENRSPTPLWFQQVCQQLLAQQCQEGLFTWGYGDTETSKPPETAVNVKMPLDPANYAPTFASRTAVIDELSKWQQAAAEWRVFARQDKAMGCSAIVATLTAVLPLMPELPGNKPMPLRQHCGKLPADEKVLSLLAERGEMVTADLQRYANVNNVKVMAILDEHLTAGLVAKRPKGRGVAWRLADAAGA